MNNKTQLNRIQLNTPNAIKALTERGADEMSRMPIGHRFSLIIGRDKEGTEHRTEVQKVSEDEVIVVRRYTFS